MGTTLAQPLSSNGDRGRPAAGAEGDGASFADRLPYALLRVGPTGRLTWANEPGRRLLERSTVLRRQGDSIVCARSELRARFHAALVSACLVGAESLIRLPSRSTAGAGSDALCWISPAAGDGASESAWVAVSERSLPRALSANAVRAAFGLTPRQARLTCALAEGRTLGDYAREAGVSLTTARSQLKEIFSRTQVFKQSQLVSVVLSSVAVLAGSQLTAEPAHRAPRLHTAAVEPGERA